MRAMSETHNTSSRTRILLADDHAMVVEGLRALLENSYEIVGVAADGRELLEVACKLQPEVIVVDVSMPSLNGLDAAERLKTLLPNVKLVFLTMQDNSNLAAAALSLGAVGYVLKHSAASELMTAISAVLEGKSYVTPKLRPENWAVREARAQQYSKELTPRQRDVLQLLAEGRGMKEIAAILEVSNRTIMYHKYHIMQEFNLKNNADIVLFAIKQHLIPACDIT